MQSFSGLFHGELYGIGSCIRKLTIPKINSINLWSVCTVICSVWCSVCVWIRSGTDEMWSFIRHSLESLVWVQWDYDIDCDILLCFSSNTGKSEFIDNERL